MKRNILIWVLIVFIGISLSGCTLIFQKGRRSDLEKIDRLSRKLDEFDRAQKILEKRSD